MRHTFTLLFCFLCSCFSYAQMPAPDGTVSYGNEWIDYDAGYLRIAVAEDGLYRVDAARLAAAGMPLTEENQARFVLHHAGRVVPVEVSGEGIAFVGRQNRGELDRYLFPDPDAQQLNDRYSLHNDTAAYYLSLSTPGAGSFFRPGEISGDATDLSTIIRDQELVFSDELIKEYFRSGRSSIYFSHYDDVEGFSSRSRDDLLSSNGTTISEFQLPLPGSTGGAATLDVRFGLGFDFHSQQISIDGQLLRQVDTTAWTVLQPRLAFVPSGPDATVRLEGVSGSRDKAAVAWARATYPAAAAYDESLTSFIIPASASASRVTFTGLGAAAGAVKGYGAENSTVVNGTIDASGNATLVFPPDANDQRYYLSVNGQARAAATSPVTFSTALPASGQTDYLIVTSRRLHGAAVESLASYRRSAAGGGYTVHVVEVEDLYEEFGYGVARHPMALRNYFSAARLAAPGLQYLFLIGKGREYEEIRTGEALAAAGETFQVPSFGFPASDNLLAAPLGSVIPKLSTGRLAAVSNAEIQIYLDKLRGVEAQINLGEQTLEDRTWMKTVLHLGGGSTPSEQSSIRSGLFQLAGTLEETSMGANVVSFFKTSDEPIEDSRSAAIFETINNGTAVITFFGHASSQGFDFSIDNPDNYNNRDRYPFMMSLGCYSGDAFTKARSISERFLFLQDKGAIAFGATKGVGYISALRSWGDSLYTVLGEEQYGMGIGDIVRSNIAKFSGTSNFTIAILLEQFALSGDPAYRLHPRPGPDLVVDPASVRFEPDVIPAQEPAYTMNFNLVNIGSGNLPDSITLRFRQELPDGEIIELHTERVSTPGHDREMSVVLENQGVPAIGQNRIFLSVDANDELAERPLPDAENNNELVTGGAPGVPLTFIANTAKAAYPPPYAVVGGEVELISSSTNALAPARDYLIQMATTRDFAAPVVDETINSPGGIIRYTPTITLTDSTTYYWRISPDSTTTEGAGFIWSESSFTWLADQPAEQIDWAMQHQGQTIDGEFENIRGNALEEGWEFSQTITDISYTNGLYVNRQLPRMEFNGQRFNSAFNWRTRSGVVVWVVDSINSRDWYENDGSGAYNSVPHSGANPFWYYNWSFNTKTQAGRAGLIDFLDNGIPEGKYVTVYSAQRGGNTEYYNEGWLADSATLGRTVFDALEDQGALQVRNISSLGSVPFVFAFQKGLGRLGEAIANTPEDVIILELEFKANWPEGGWSTGPVGPASEWNSMDIRLSSANVSPSDSVSVLLYGIDATGTETLLEEQRLVVPSDLSLNIDLTMIDATAYPNLRAGVMLFDEENRTAATVRHVYFSYSRPPDLAVNPQLSYSAPDSLDQGEIYDLTVGYENISPVDADSLLVELQVIDQNNNLTTLTTRQPPVAAGTTGEVSFSLPTEPFSNDVRLQLRLNPEQDQPEQTLFNNDLTTRLKIGRDVIDPDLRVYFDGRRINDGELVSARPEILIQLRDENTFMPLNDTSSYVIELTSPSGSRERLRFADERVEFRPAATSDNIAEIFFRPTLAEDGIYALTVQAADRNDNRAGRLDFRQEFEILNEQRVANVLTYPNPFSTQTQFVYTLTGSEPPGTFRIQIMTVSGRVVRDIDLLAIEDVKIGTHRTRYAWDGTDEYGDQLANGVYLYRVITDDGAGNPLEKFDTGTDQFFRNELGKVVILR